MLFQFLALVLFQSPSPAASSAQHIWCQAVASMQDGGWFFSSVAFSTEQEARQSFKELLTVDLGPTREVNIRCRSYSDAAEAEIAFAKAVGFMRARGDVYRYNLATKSRDILAKK